MPDECTVLCMLKKWLAQDVCTLGSGICLQNLSAFGTQACNTLAALLRKLLCLCCLSAFDCNLTRSISECTTHTKACDLNLRFACIFGTHYAGQMSACTLGFGLNIFQTHSTCEQSAVLCAYCTHVGKYPNCMQWACNMHAPLLYASPLRFRPGCLHFGPWHGHLASTFCVHFFCLPTAFRWLFARVVQELRALCLPLNELSMHIVCTCL